MKFNKTPDLQLFWGSEDPKYNVEYSKLQDFSIGANYKTLYADPELKIECGARLQFKHQIDIDPNLKTSLITVKLKEGNISWFKSNELEPGFTAIVSGTGDFAFAKGYVYVDYRPKKNFFLIYFEKE